MERKPHEVISYNAVIQACGEGQQWRLALCALEELQLNALELLGQEPE